MVFLAVLGALVLVGLAVFRKNYRRKYREPARSCLALNRASRQNRLCQNATPRGGYCRIHNNQRSLNQGSVWAAGFLGAVAIGVAIYFQVNPLPALGA